MDEFHEANKELAQTAANKLDAELSPKCEICGAPADEPTEIRDPRASHFVLCADCERIFFRLEVEG